MALFALRAARENAEYTPTRQKRPPSKAVSAARKYSAAKKSFAAYRRHLLWRLQKLVKNKISRA
jgi:hypothetical protein